MEPLKAKKQHLFSEWVLAKVCRSHGIHDWYTKSWELLPPFYVNYKMFSFFLYA